MVTPRVLSLAVLLTFLASTAAVAAAGDESLASYLTSIIQREGLEKALESYRSLGNRRPRYAVEEQQLLVVGQRLIAAGRYEEAMTFYTTVLDRYPSSSRITIAMGDAALRAGESVEAHQWYARAMRLLPRDHRLAAELQNRMARRVHARMQRIRYDPLLDRHSGIFRLEDGRLVAVARCEIDGRQTLETLRLVDLGSGSVRTLYPSGSATFVAGPGLLTATPEQQRVSFDRDGDSIRIRSGGARPTKGSRLNISSSTPVTLTNGDVRLAGTLSVPSGPGPHPAVVMIHGSGNAGRNTSAYGDLVNLLLLHGYAVLRHDKRGTRESTGDWRSASANDLAADTLAAVRYLRGCPSIDPRQIGVFGFSQGAWIAGLAAARSSDVAFAILVSGGAVPPREQEIYRVGAELRAAGYDDDAVLQATGFMRLKLDVARTGSGWETFADAMESAEQEPWYPAFTGRWSSLEAARAIWDRMLAIEPSRYLARLGIPVLALYGELDTLTPTDASVAALHEIYRGREQLLTVAIIPRANHFLLEATSGDLRGGGELAKLTHYAPAAIAALQEWLVSLHETKRQLPPTPVTSGSQQLADGL